MAKRIFLSLALLLTTIVSTWAEDVKYIYYTAIVVNNDVSLNKFSGTASNPTVLTSNLLENSSEDNLDSGWYVLNSTFSYGERIVISGDVKLILKDGCTLTAKQGIRINTDAKLSIYAQSEEVETMGKLVAIETHHDKAAIGGNKNYRAGELFIHGGEIEAKCNDGSKYAAGIGGGYGDGSGMKGITIYCGKVTTKGADSGAGIGGGKNNNHPCVINIYGGDIKANGGKGGAGIGGGKNRGNWPVNIYGGKVVAEGKEGGFIPLYGSAGIGSGDRGQQTAPVKIYGGNVTAKGDRGAGIGGGNYGKAGEVYIYGGTVTAKAGANAAGIGGGYNNAGGDVHISGGNVTAENAGHGASIGGGYEANGGSIEITGGHVTAKTIKHYSGTLAACNIGCGKGGDGANIILGNNICVKPQSGLVTASNRVAACKGPRTGYGDNNLWTVEVYECEHNDLTYNYINESAHSAVCKYCKYNQTEGHAIVAPSTTCDKCGYGDGVNICTLAFFQTTTEPVTGYMTSGFQAVEGQTVTMPSCNKIPNGYKFVGWLKQNELPTSIEAADSETLLQPSDEYTVEGSERFFARYRYDFAETWAWDDDLTTATLTIQAAGGEPINVTPVTVSNRTETAATDAADGSIKATATATYTHGNTTYTFSSTQTKVLSYDLSLGEDDNTEALATYNGRSMNVTFTGRTLYKNDSWNTLCLPFDVEDISGSPLAGATVKELTDASFDNSTGTLTLTFADATSIKAGQAYLIKWPDSGTTLGPSDLVFTGVTLANGLNDDEISTDDSSTATVTFMGTYKKLTFDAEDRTILFLGAGNTLYYPQRGAIIGAQRGYFKLSGLTAGDLPKQARAFVLNSGDEETTGIRSLTSSSSPKGKGSDYWYTLDGRRLGAKPTQKGIYINNGRKAVIK